MRGVKLINSLEKLMSDSEKYTDYAQQIDQVKADRKIRKTLYISRRAIWVNILLTLFISPLGSYIHTRRWKALGIFALCSAFFFAVIPAGSYEEGESFEESFVKGFEQGMALSPFISVIAAIDNSLAIRRARQTVANSAEEDK
jgi:ATP/ADP translocase